MAMMLMMMVLHALGSAQFSSAVGSIWCQFMSATHKRLTRDDTFIVILTMLTRCKNDRPCHKQLVRVSLGGSSGSSGGVKLGRARAVVSALASMVRDEQLSAFLFHFIR